MMTYFYATNHKGVYLFDNFPTELKGLVASTTIHTRPIKIMVEGKELQARMARAKNDYGVVYILTTETKYINRDKLFKELIESSKSFIKPFTDLQENIIKQQSEQTEEFIHNLTSLNSYSIQQLFSLIPQRVLTENINKQSDTVRDIINQKPNIAVLTLQKLIKYNLAMKVEFSVFERTVRPVAVVRNVPYSIREIILSILQIFIEDFETKHIEVSVDATEKRLLVDYDSLFVSLYYLLDNAVKYSCPHTLMKIQFREETDAFSVLFVMISLKISEGEVEKLNIRGYRSPAAQDIHKDSRGIGMYRIQKTLALNNAELIVTPRCNSFTKTVSKVNYEGNEFKIKFRGQQSWLK